MAQRMVKLEAHTQQGERKQRKRTSSWEKTETALKQRRKVRQQRQMLGRTEKVEEGEKKEEEGRCWGYLACWHVSGPGRPPGALLPRCHRSACWRTRRRWWNPGGWHGWSSGPCWRCPGWTWGSPRPGRPPPPNQTTYLSGGAGGTKAGRGLVRVTHTHSTLSPDSGIKSVWSIHCRQKKTMIWVSANKCFVIGVRRCIIQLIHVICSVIIEVEFNHTLYNKDITVYDSTSALEHIYIINNGHSH